VRDRDLEVHDPVPVGARPGCIGASASRIPFSASSISSREARAISATTVLPMAARREHPALTGFRVSVQCPGSGE
jgi:hypothetical protein